MKILHLNTYTLKHNLSFPHYQLHKNLLKAGHESYILSASGDVEEANIKYLKGNRRLPFFDISRLVRKIYFEIIKKNADNYFYPEWNLDCVTSDQIEKILTFKPDLIITYWTKFAFNSKLQYELSRKFKAPVLTYMMDMAPITGGCHYAFDCTKYQSGCGQCPAISSKKEKDLSFKTFRNKEKYISKTNISLIVGTETLIKQAQKSKMWQGKEKYEMMLSVDENIFIPKEIEKSKQALGISPTKKVIFFGAAAISDKRKGLYHLLVALNELALNNPQLRDEVLILIAGKKLPEVTMPFEYKYLGYLSTEEELAMAYQAADVFACPSIEDSGPMMINQAIMSGRPVVSFNMGVAPDLVFTGETGYLANLADSSDFAKGLKNILELSEEDWNIMSSNSRQLGIEKCSMKTQTERFEKIIKALKIIE